jgi:hypothetical protein
VAAGGQQWNPIYLFFASMHLVLCFPHFSTVMIVRTAGELMQLKPLVNINMIKNEV